MFFFKMRVTFSESSKSVFLKCFFLTNMLRQSVKMLVQFLNERTILRYFL